MDYTESIYYDEPVEYKDLKIYPAIMRDYIKFHMFINCLMLDKNSIPSIEIISMSYLQFLYYISDRDNLPYVYMLKMLLCMVLHLDEGKDEFKFYLRDGKAYFSINSIEYTSNDFDEIMKIIMLQNCIKPIDYTIQKEIRDELERAERFRMQQQSNKICSLEEQMICVLISTPLKFEDIYKLTIRKFEKILKRVDAKLHYQIYLNASMSGMVQLKNPNVVQHWMNDLSKDQYADVMMDMEQMQSKIADVNR